ncbi:MAG: hypothetical protein JXA13_03380 [Anaerolineales bacterium]|nr:hypothetical protein [Anaerolineales bacterium]
MSQKNNPLQILYRMAGLGAGLQFILVLIMLAAAITLGIIPTTVEEYFRIYQNNLLAGMLQDDFTSLLMISTNLFTFPGLYAALKTDNKPFTAFATVLTFQGAAVAFASHSGFAFMHLSAKYAAAASDLQRSQLLAAGEAVLANNLWNGTGGFMAGILLQGSGLLISAIMLCSKKFSKLTAITGILGNGLDLTQHLLHLFLPSLAAPIQMIMGPFYMLWFPLLGRDFFRLARQGTTDQDFEGNTIMGKK